MATRAITVTFILLTALVCALPLLSGAADMTESDTVIAQRLAMQKLHIAVRTADAAGIEAALAAGVPVNESAALHLAILMDRQDLVDLLIAHGADPNRPDLGGELPVVTALKRGNEPLMRHLVERGAEPDRPDRSGRTALEYAQALGRSEAAAWLRGQRHAGGRDGPRESAPARP